MEAPTLTCIIVAVQNPRSSRNKARILLCWVDIVAVQNPRSSRNWFPGVLEQERIVAVQNPRSSRNGQQRHQFGITIVAVQNPRSSRLVKSSCVNFVVIVASCQDFQISFWEMQPSSFGICYAWPFLSTPPSACAASRTDQTARRPLRPCL